MYSKNRVTLRKIPSEICFFENNIANKGMEKYYIQSAYRLDSDEKREQELNSLHKINDSFRKIVIVGDDIIPYTDEKGITFMGLFYFLLKW